MRIWWSCAGRNALREDDEMQYFWAFVVGGLICVVGQLLIDLTANYGIGEKQDWTKK